MAWPHTGVCYKYKTLFASEGEINIDVFISRCVRYMNPSNSVRDLHFGQHCPSSYTLSSSVHGQFRTGKSFGDQQVKSILHSVKKERYEEEWIDMKQMGLRLRLLNYLQDNLSGNVQLKTFEVGMY